MNKEIIWTPLQINEEQVEEIIRAFQHIKLIIKNKSEK